MVTETEGAEAGGEPGVGDEQRIGCIDSSDHDRDRGKDEAR
jgi:hypothetical protein